MQKGSNSGKNYLAIRPSHFVRRTLVLLNREKSCVSVNRNGVSRAEEAWWEQCNKLQSWRGHPCTPQWGTLKWSFVRCRANPGPPLKQSKQRRISCSIFLGNINASELTGFFLLLFHLCCFVGIVQCSLQDIPIDFCREDIKQFMSLVCFICALLFSSHITN